MSAPVSSLPVKPEQQMRRIGFALVGATAIACMALAFTTARAGQNGLDAAGLAEVTASIR